MTILGNFEEVARLMGFLGGGGLDRGLEALAGLIYRDVISGEILLPSAARGRNLEERLEIDGAAAPRYVHPEPKELLDGLMERADDPGVADFGAAIHRVMRTSGPVESKAGERFLLEMQAVPESGEIIEAALRQPGVLAWQIRIGSPGSEGNFAWISGAIHKAPQSEEADAPSIIEEIQGLLDALDLDAYERSTAGPEGFDMDSLSPAISLYIWREKPSEIPF